MSAATLPAAAGGIFLSAPRATRETALAFNRGAIFLACDGSTPLSVYRMETLRVLDPIDYPEYPRTRVLWTLHSQGGEWWDGGMNELDIHHGSLFIRPANPVLTRLSPYGVRVVFKFRLPRHWKLFHLSQYRRKHPELALRYSDLLMMPG